ncbi:hypothetical protein ABBQ38_000358 [Trebouxia sp. C0009 RCD-2024]
MGLDGGTYITRSDVLRGQSWELAQADNSRSTRGGNASTSAARTRNTVDAHTAKSTRWSTCSLSNQPLQAPIVADFLGNLYNREAVLEFLLSKGGAFVDDSAQHRYLNQQRASRFGYEHLQSIRDVFTVHLTEHADLVGQQPTTTDAEVVERFICPVTQLHSTRYPFVAIASCGHVFSDRAVKQMTDCCCATCGTKFAEAQLIPVNGTPEQVERLKAALPSRKQKQPKSGSKRKRSGLTADPT